jgi:hypothetical protein
MSLKIGGSLLTLAVVLACAGRTTTSVGTAGVSPSSGSVTVAGVAGEYSLLSVDGHKLPYAPTGAAARPIVSGNFSLNPNGTFRLVTAYDASDAGAKGAAALSGACYTEGNEVKMVWDDGLANATVRGDTVFFKRDGAMYAYLRSR